MTDKIPCRVHGKSKGKYELQNNIHATVEIETQGGETNRAIQVDIYKNATGDGGRISLMWDRIVGYVEFSLKDGRPLPWTPWRVTQKSLDEIRSAIGLRKSPVMEWNRGEWGQRWRAPVTPKVPENPKQRNMF